MLFRVVIIFALFMLDSFCISQVCADDSLVEILKEKVVALDNSLSLDIRLRLQEFNRIADLLDDTFATLKADKEQHIGNPGSHTKTLETTQSIERAMSRIKRAFAEEKAGLKKFTSTMKTEIYKLSGGINQALDDFEIRHIEANKESMDKLDSFQSDLAKDLSREMTVLGTKLSSSVKSMSSEIAKETNMAISTMEKMTQNIDMVSEIKNSIDDISQNFATSEQAIRISERMEAFEEKLETVNEILDLLVLGSSSGILLIGNNTILQKGNVRLVNVSEVPGSTVEGRLEVMYDGEWGTVCDDDFDLSDAKTACRMLGLSRPDSFKGDEYYGRGVGTIMLDNLACSGTEFSLFKCGHDGIKVNNCGHHEDVGVKCYY